MRTKNVSIIGPDKIFIQVHDTAKSFYVEVTIIGGFDGEKVVKGFGWHGGDFVFRGNPYTLRGPYHGLDHYRVFRLVEQQATETYSRLPARKDVRVKKL